MIGYPDLYILSGCCHKGIQICNSYLNVDVWIPNHVLPKWTNDNWAAKQVVLI